MKNEDPDYFYENDHEEFVPDYQLDYSEEEDFYDESSLPRRAKYNMKMDQFLNNGILIVGVLLILVLVIAFLL